VAQRLRIEYADQNEAFAPLLPRSGVLARTYSDTHGNAGWSLLRLDEPFEYQLKVGEPLKFRLLHVAHFLVRSRWAGYPIGEKEPTAVSILLVDGTAILRGGKFSRWRSTNTRSVLRPDRGPGGCVPDYVSARQVCP